MAAWVQHQCKARVSRELKRAENLLYSGLQRVDPKTKKLVTRRIDPLNASASASVSAFASSSSNRTAAGSAAGQ